MQNFKNFLILFTSLFLLISCSNGKSTKEFSTEIVNLIETSGKIELEISGDQWQKIKVKGASAVLTKDKVGIEQAMNVATLRAKASLAEFLDNQVRSNKTTATTTSSTIKEGNTSEISNEINTIVAEDIASSARSIIKGAYIISRETSPDQTYVSVTLLIDRKVVEISKEITKSLY